MNVERIVNVSQNNRGQKRTKESPTVNLLDTPKKLKNSAKTTGEKPTLKQKTISQMLNQPQLQHSQTQSRGEKSKGTQDSRGYSPSLITESPPRLDMTASSHSNSPSPYRGKGEKSKPILAPPKITYGPVETEEEETENSPDNVQTEGNEETDKLKAHQPRKESTTPISIDLLTRDIQKLRPDATATTPSDFFYAQEDGVVNLNTEFVSGELYRSTILYIILYYTLYRTTKGTSRQN
jgi:hypothetical protein